MIKLLKMAFSRPSNSRQLTFEEIAAKTKLPLNEVNLIFEWILWTLNPHQTFYLDWIVSNASFIFKFNQRLNRWNWA